MALRKKRKAEKRAREQAELQAKQTPPDRRLFFNQNQASDAEGETEQAVVMVAPVVTELTIKNAHDRLIKYRQHKANLEKRLVANEDYWKLRQWNYYEENKKKSNNKIATAWLWNCITSKHADLMDGYPESNIRPKQHDDVQEAEKLKSILPVIMAENDYENTYSELCNSILKQGVCCAGVYWDGSKHNGLGDVSVEEVNLLELYWESGVTDIQDSKEVFHTKLIDNDTLTAMYPQLEGELGGNKLSQTKFNYDDTVDEDNKSTVVDWYYKKTDEKGNQILHYCKFTGRTVLFASENEPDKYPNGWYEHGLFPYVTQALFPVKGSLAGYGYTDIGRGDQHAIDTLTSAILTNAKVTSKPRYFIRLKDSGINEAEFADFEKDFVHVNGSLDETNIKPIVATSINSNVLNVREQFINELKETLGNRDVNNGGSTSGITAASALAVLQEQSGKLSRTHNKLMYTMHTKITNMVIELIRQFYTIPREYRITGQMGKDEFVNYDNSGLVPQPQPEIMGMDMGLRLPCFDIEVTAQKSSPYNKMEQNELAIQLYNLGVFSPQNTDMALALLKTMDFAHKDEIMQMVSSNGTLLQKYQSLQQVALQFAQDIDARHGTDVTQALMQVVMAESGQAMPQQVTNENVDLAESTGEHPYVEKARAQARNSTQVRE